MANEEKMDAVEQLEEYEECESPILRRELSRPITPVFDAFAPLYGRFHELPFSKYCVEYSLRKLLGNEVSGASVVDLGCGEGHYSRLMKEMEAIRVVGVDVSSRMITLAKEEENESPLGIQYVHSGIYSFRRCEEFGIALLVFVLDLAADPAELGDMCRVALKHLAPGGKLFIITTMAPPASATPTSDYDFTKHGMTIKITSIYQRDSFKGELGLSLEDPELESPVAKTTIFSQKTYEETLEGLGFQEVTIRPLEVSPECPPEYDAEFWESVLESKLFYSIVCMKDPAEVPEVLEPAEVPKVKEPAEVPEVKEPAEVPEVKEPVEVPQVLEPVEVPQVLEPVEVPEVKEPVEVPEVLEPVEVPEVLEPVEVPEVLEPAAEPEIKDPR